MTETFMKNASTECRACNQNNVHRSVVEKHIWTQLDNDVSPDIRSLTSFLFVILKYWTPILNRPVLYQPGVLKSCTEHPT